MVRLILLFLVEKVHYWMFWMHAGREMFAMNAFSCPDVCMEIAQISLTVTALMVTKDSFVTHVSRPLNSTSDILTSSSIF